jgi:hypothetical protein
MTKTRTLDVAKVNDALKRAARVAVSGSREDRSGRFAPVAAEKRPSPLVGWVSAACI